MCYVFFLFRGLRNGTGGLVDPDDGILSTGPTEQPKGCRGEDPFAQVAGEARGNMSLATHPRAQYVVYNAVSCSLLLCNAL